MSSAPSKPDRIPRSFWFDPRFAIGLALVALSVLGVLAIVSAADSSVQVYSARSALSPGDRVHSADLETRRVRLGSTSGKYLVSGGIPSAGFVITRAVSAGELVPTSAVGTVKGASVASLVVSMSGELARSISAGAVVDVWAASQTENNVFGPPAVIVSSATVVRVIAHEGIIAERGGESVEVLVPRAKTATVLEAIANADAISLVPTSIPAGG